MPCRQQSRDSFEELPLCTEQLVGLSQDPYSGVLESPFNWVSIYIYIYTVYNPLHKLHKQGFGHCSIGLLGIKKFAGSSTSLASRTIRSLVTKPSALTKTGGMVVWPHA